jgi:hypothetical protein
MAQRAASVGHLGLESRRREIRAEADVIDRAGSGWRDLMRWRDGFGAGMVVAALLAAGAGCGRGGHAPAHAHDHDHEHGTEGRNGQPLDHPASDPGAPCACAAANSRNGWCPRCNVGWIGGLKVVDADLFELIDPHGHDYQPATIECVACRAAMERDGFCEVCRTGYIADRLYVTRLSWACGRAQPGPEPEPACAACRAGRGPGAWCAACSVGRLGPHWYAQRAVFDVFLEERDRLERAIAVGRECRVCSLSLMMGRRCNACGRDHGAEWERRGLARPDQPVDSSRTP